MIPDLHLDGGYSSSFLFLLKTSKLCVVFLWGPLHC